MQEGHFPDQEICLLHVSLSNLTEGHLHIHGFYTWPLYTTKVVGQDRGRIQRHLLLTHRGTAALSGQAFNLSNPQCVAT
jgi:hypothetical protein